MTKTKIKEHIRKHIDPYNIKIAHINPASFIADSLSGIVYLTKSYSDEFLDRLEAEINSDTWCGNK